MTDTPQPPSLKIIKSSPTTNGTLTSKKRKLSLNNCENPPTKKSFEENVLTNDYMVQKYSGLSITLVKVGSANSPCLSSLTNK